MILTDILFAVLFGMLSGMGIGGGGLLVIYLTLFRGYSQIDAQGANLIFFAVAACGAMLVHFKKRNLRIKLILTVAFLGILGSFAGSNVTAVIPQELTSKLYGAMLIISGFLTAAKELRKSKTSRHIKL